MKEITNKGDLTEHFHAGWRLHHSFENEGKKKTYLSHAREANNLDIFKSKMFTVNEEALVEKSNGHFNYEFIFSSLDHLNVLNKNYEEKGFVLTVIFNNFRIMKQSIFY